MRKSIKQRKNPKQQSTQKALVRDLNSRLKDLFSGKSRYLSQIINLFSIQ